MQYKREIKEKILSLSKQFPVLILTGARQTGKTTLLKSIFPKYSYVSLDLPSEAELAEKDPEAFLKRHSKPVLIDEVQYAPNLFRHIKIEVDNNRSSFGQFILTGSQKFNLMKDVSDSLAGRCVILELETLSYSEIKTSLDLKDKDSLIWRGGFPELWKNIELTPYDYLSSYVATYLERDVRQLLNISSLRDFERFMRVTAMRSGALLNKTEISKEIGVSLATINAWISVLEASNQIVLLEPYFGNISKRIVKTPKIYFCDTGMLCFLLGVNNKNLDRSPFNGAIWETFILSEIRKTIINKRTNSSIYFYRDKDGKEIDFLISDNEGFTMVECKWTQYPDKHDVSAMNALKEAIDKNKKTKLKITQQIVACRTSSEYPIDEYNRAINGYSISDYVN